jgi:hypothetical protein
MTFFGVSHFYDRESNQKYPEESSGIFRLANFSVDLYPLFKKNELFSKGILYNNKTSRSLAYISAHFGCTRKIWPGGTNKDLLTQS